MAAVLAKVRAVVPPQFLKTSDDIHCHRKILHHVLLNNLQIHDALSGGAGDPSAPPPTASDRASTATEAVRLLQRTAAISGLARAFTRRASLRSQNGGSGAISRLYNPLAAYFGAPGSKWRKGAERSVSHIALFSTKNALACCLLSNAGGKTTVLELAAELTTGQSWSAELCPDPVMRGALNASIAVAVTYNSGMDADILEFDADPESGLALRALYCALVRDDPMAYSFLQFWSDWSAGPILQMRLNLQQAIDACLLAFSELAPHRTGLLLLIDETRKLAEAFKRKSGHGISDGRNLVYDMLGAVGRSLDLNRPAKLNIACTTLDSMMLQAVSTTSGRKIDWVCLDGLRQSAAEAMIMRALGCRPDRVPALVALSIADCARHPRTLESLCHALHLRASERKGCPDWFYDPGELKEIRRMVSSSVTSVSPLWAIRAALSGVALPYDAVVEGSGGVTFGDAIAEGVFLNTMEAEKGVVDVPRLSFMHLLHSADTMHSSISGAVLGMAAQEEAGLDTPPKSRPPFGGTGFEGFVLRWLQLRFSLAAAASGGARGLSLQDLFAFHPDGNECDDDSLGRRLLTGSPSHPLRFKRASLPDVDFATAVTDPGSRRLLDEVIAAGGSAVTFSANNPAFDILLLVHAADAAAGAAGAAQPPLFAIAIEPRFSSPSSSLRTTAEEVTRKVDLFHAQLGAGGPFEALGIPADRVKYVLMASRLDGGPQADSEMQLQSKSPAGLASPPSHGLTVEEKAAYLKRGVIILDRAGVERALTPTLVDRAFLLLPPRGFNTAPPSG